MSLCCRILFRGVGNLRLFTSVKGVEVTLCESSIDQRQAAVFYQDRVAVSEGFFGLRVAAKARQRRALRAFGEPGAPVIGGQRRRIDRLGLAREIECRGVVFLVDSEDGQSDQAGGYVWMLIVEQPATHGQPIF